jgi:hypothetical protein
MPSTKQQTGLAGIIETHATDVLAHSGGEEELLMSLADNTGTLYASWY